MSFERITAVELRRDVADVLDRYDMTLDDFIAADLDDLEDDELRDLWLLTRTALLASA